MSTKRIDAARKRIAKLEQRLYSSDVKLSAARRFDTSMKLSAERVALAALLKIKMWSADAALDTPEED